MQIEPDTWHVKWFFLSTTLFEAWKDSIDPPEFTIPIETNLCPYMRRLLVTFPLLLLFYGCVIGLFVYAILIYPVTHFGWKYFAYIIAGLLLFGLVIAFIYGLNLIFPRVTAFLADYVFEPIGNMFIYLGEKTEACIMGQPDAPTFCGIVRQWIIDSHDKICRPITIDRE